MHHSPEAALEERIKQISTELKVRVQFVEVAKMVLDLKDHMRDIFYSKVTVEEAAAVL